MASALQEASGHTCSDRYRYQPFLFDSCCLFVLHVIAYSDLGCTAVRPVLALKLCLGRRAMTVGNDSVTLGIIEIYQVIQGRYVLLQKRQDR